MKKAQRKDESAVADEGSRTNVTELLQFARNGFTLMELLLAITLFSIIAVAIYSSLAMGIRVHKRGSNIGGEYSDLRLALDRITKDLHTAINMNNIYLVRESQNLYFFSIQSTSDGTRELYKITYSWEREKDYFILLRLKETYQESLQDVHPEGDELLDSISELRFDFGYLKKSMSGEEDFQWKEQWKEEAVPKMVRLSLERSGEKYNKIIYCPAGKMGAAKEE